MRAALPDPHRPGPIVGGRAGPWLPGGVSNADTGTAYSRPAGTSLLDLAQVGPGTPYGEVLRRYWQPVALSAAALVALALRFGDGRRAGMPGIGELVTADRVRRSRPRPEPASARQH